MERPRDALPEGTKLAGYVIGRVLGRGGFGVTYFGHDALFPETKVAIKEFLPSGLAVREPGSLTVHPSNPGYAEDFRKALSRFEEEARTLVALRHPNVVEVQRYIEANGTAYVVMKYEEGRSLSELLDDCRTLSAAELDEIVAPLLAGLEAVHKRNYLHRDIKPGNIYIRAVDGSPVLLDFGAARQAMGAERKTSLTEIVTPGYAPFEQYFRKGEQGPWTDLYALGATFYRCIAGTAPPEAPERVRRDEMVPAREAGRARYPEPLLAGIDAMLAVDEKNRPQSVSAVRALLAAREAPVLQPAAGQTTLVAGAPPAAAAPERLDIRGGQGEARPGQSSPPKINAELSRPRAPSRRRSVFGAIAGVAFLAAVLAAGGYFVSRYDSEQERSSPAPPPLGSEATCREGSGWRAGCVFRDCPECPEMVVIPDGTFTMGSPAGEEERIDNEGPQHRVNIAKPFALRKYEVTFADWDACVAAGGCSHRPGDEGWGRDRRPAINVSWADAKQYVAWLSGKTGKTYRLPSEAEWEYAARAKTTTAFSTGPTISTDQANYDGDRVYGSGQKGVYRERTVPVGSFKANPFGLHDMHGNVGELTEDCWNENYNGAPSDGTAWLTGECHRRVLRGGSWLNGPRILRSANRFGGPSTDRFDGLGFRVARTF